MAPVDSSPLTGALAPRTAAQPPSIPLVGPSRRLRIALVAPPWLPVPPPAYGGTENLLDALARGLQAAGHEVLLCASGDSTCPVARSSVFERAIGVGLGNSVDEIRHVLHSYEAVHEADVVHDHTLVGPLYAAAFPHLPVVTTNHGPFNEDLIDLYRVLARRMQVIAISHHQASTARNVPIAAVIHHGVDLADFPDGPGGGGYALFLGRMHPGKGPHIAAEVARAAGYPLRIAAKMREPQERDYFDAMVRPLLGADVSYIGEVDRSEKLELLSGADCLINPIAWDEPFGMVMLEALACGTPVLTTPRGAAPEIVKDGVVGFVREDAAGLVSALARIGEIDRASCRLRVEQKFSVEVMVRGHLAVYERALSENSNVLIDELVPGAA
ncbi:MAG: glycosyl transferase group 1 [Acidimicrobiaceae bacterium]|nr:glycosyl transferase group 1 [Acidimicrobiaceae bacterium]